jgi:hypothetical protein
MKEDLIKDFLWYEYEGDIIYNTWNKGRIKDVRDKDTIKNLVQRLKINTRMEDIKEFYKIDRSIFNVCLIAGEEWADLNFVYNRYQNNKKENEEHFIDDYILEYLIWGFKDNVKNFKRVLDIYNK